MQELWNKVKNKPNVCGYEKKLVPKIVKGKETDTLAFRVYVTKKVAEEDLDESELIPSVLTTNDGEKVYTDVVEIGFVKALQKTKRHRPVFLGVSIGHEEITAGSLGMLYNYQGAIVAGSNAHVLTPDPSLSAQGRILQPGKYHGGTAEDTVGWYLWHQRIKREDETCPIASGVTKVLNAISAAFGRRSRFKVESEPPMNNVDFAVYTPTVEHVYELHDGRKPNHFIGHLFAGSDAVGVICKARNIVELGFEPLVDWQDVNIGNAVFGSSFWCEYETQVISTDAVLRVNYGSYNAWFEDVILVNNDGSIKGGWSGSGWWLKQ